MYQITKQAEAYLEALADALEVPQTRYEQAQRSYKSLGEWFHGDQSSVAQHEPSVYIQGSFQLGTVIKPHSNEEQYDIDCTCILSALSKSCLSQAQLKEMIGDEVKSYRNSVNIAKPVEPKQRCWRLKYSDEAQFHMDIVPGVPNGKDQRRLLEERMLDTSYAETAIAITDNTDRHFQVINENWPRSNPKGYAEWFKSRMGDVFIQGRERVLKEMQSRGNTIASVEDVPTYRVRTPLQSAIMILKHHRNNMFADDTTDAPISIIISTLAAHAYNGEETIGYGLLAILSRMREKIDHDGQKYIIRNPTDETENFADKWETHPERADAFDRWLEQARHDFASAARLSEPQRIAENLEDRMGRTVTATASDTVLHSGSSSLLGNATTATSAAAPNVSFADTPRTPKKPDGFA